jgi:predicted nucleotidyltransferase
MQGKRTIKEIEQILPEVKKLLKQIYADRLVDAILYGSFVRNEATEDSDIDIAVILKGKVDKPKEIDRIYDQIYELVLESGELISIHPVSDEELKNSIWPLYQHIKDEGIKL